MPNDYKELIDLQHQILQEIDDLKYGDLDKNPSFGQKLADKVVGLIGSWVFISVQGVVLALWIAVNAFWIFKGQSWDPYPFILLNLILSFQAAFTSPLILMAQNRAEQKDRRRAQNAYRSIDHVEYMLSALVEKLKEKNGQKSKEKDRTETKQ